MEGDDNKQWRDREALRQIVMQWNANRLDLFSLSEPNDDLEFHGVMRFYFQDAGQKIATKCVRVSSTASTKAVIETLIEKFRPDMKMLHMTEYALYEIHPNGEERRLGEDEKPLLVQLNWHKDDREGRFLLRRADEKSTLPALQPPEESSFRRKLSKRDKRSSKKENKLRRMKSGTTGPGEEEEPANGDPTKGGSVAEKLYTELPETSFTRSISNPEAVMRRRRQQKLERKLQQFRSKDGGPDTGGTLKIYGESLCKDVPYKTLLLSIRETAAYVVKEMLDKYGLTKEDPANYCLVQVSQPPPGSTESPSEYILEDEECPLSILMNVTPSQGQVMFHVRRRPADQLARRRKKKLSGSSGNTSTSTINRLPGVGAGASSRLDLTEGEDRNTAALPYLLELNPDGSDTRTLNVRRHLLPPSVTEVGSERQSGSGANIQLFGPGLLPRHCVIAHTEGIVTITPCSPQAETFVNGQRINETTLLQHGSIVRFGRVHQFRFIDPGFELRGAPPAGPNYERFPNRGAAKSGPGSTLGSDPILPAVLELPEETEDAFLHALISNLDSRQVAFRLAPTYSLYLAARYRASTHFRPDLNPMERAQRLTLTMSRVGAMIEGVVQERYADPPSLAFWMANASELLHFLKFDRHICAFSLDAQELLADAVQIAFRNLSVCLTGELLQSLPAMLAEREEPPDDDASTAQVLSVLSSTMGLLRRCRVNAALTIQLFSQLFYTLNAAIFNRIIGIEAPRLPHPQAPAHYCSRAWGIRLGRRLRRLELWAERQGLELAADCHLARVMQAAHLLQAPKSTPETLADVASACFKLNSMQLRALLERYRPAADESPIPAHLIEAIVNVAEGTADELQLADGQPLRLEENPQLAVPFLLPDDGYSCDVMRGIPTGLTEVLAPLQQAGLCRLTIQPSSSGHWTIYMGEASGPPAARMPAMGGDQPSEQPSPAPAQPPQQQQQPELQVLQLRKASDSMGLSIVAARGTGQQQLGIYIKSVVKGGSADIDGRLQAGDQLLSVDGNSLVGITQDRAAEILMRTGHVVTLEVAKQAAMFHGLATLLSQPSPTSTISRSSLPPKNERRPPLPHQPHPPYQERLVDWDRPQTSTSIPSLAPEQQNAAQVANAQRAVALRNANSKSVPSLNTEPAAGNEAPPTQDFYPSQHQLAPQQQMRAGGPLINQRTMSVQHLPPQQQPQRYHPAQQQHMTLPPQQYPHQQQVQQQQQQPLQQMSPSRPPLQQQQQPSTLSLPAAVRSRSVQNLNESQFQGQTASRVSLRGRHPSNPSLEEERQYQNIALYQQQQQQMPHPHMQYAGHPHQQPQQQASQMQQQQQQPQQHAPQTQQHMLQMQQQPPQLQQQQQYQQHQAQHSQQQQMHLASTQHQQMQAQMLYQQNQMNNSASQNRGLLSPVGRSSQHMRGPSYVTQPMHPQTTDSPPPPPPPPASTHPLMASTGNNPWDREEKEREQQRRQEAARMWMEQQISDLESLGPSRTSKQEEQLRALKLELEFRRRAEEAAKDEDDDEGEDDEDPNMDPHGMLRLVQEDLDRARQWRMEKEHQQQQQQQQHQQQQQLHQYPQRQQQQQQQHQQPQYIEQAALTNGGMNNNNTSGVPDQERMRKIETFQRKQRELEATQAAEEKILREAQRRKEEEQQRQQQHFKAMQQQQQQQQQYQQPPPGQRLDTLVSGTASSTLAPPATQYPGETQTASTKRVSFFQDKTPTPTMGNITYDANANQEKPREDPDAFIQEAENMFSSPTGKDQLLLTGNTPGVIGAQEVYRDPRVRRLAEQQQQQAQSKPTPEKLSFQEKMRMFALESGEPATPKDRSKISRAQRDIDLKPTPQK